MDETPFWRAKTLAQMTPQEWESLCDGCGRCCLHKLRDDDTDEILFTSVACHLLDRQSCRCGDYERRQHRVPDCVALQPAEVATIDWLPPSCAYRLVQEGRDLPWWHPLVSGDPDSVHAGGASVRGRVISERAAGALEDYVASWPGRMPRRRGPATVVRRTGAAPAPGTAAPVTSQPVTPPAMPRLATLPPAAPKPATAVKSTAPSAGKRAPGAGRRAAAPPVALVPGSGTAVAAVVAFPRPVPQTGTPGTLPPVAPAPVPADASRSRRAARAPADGARAAKAQASGAQAGAPAQPVPGPGGPPGKESGP